MNDLQQCMSPSRLQFILDEIRCLNQSVTELSQEKEKLTENILNELKTSSSFDQTSPSAASSTGGSSSAVTQVTQIANYSQAGNPLRSLAPGVNVPQPEIDLVSGTFGHRKIISMQSSNISSQYLTQPVRLSQSQQQNQNFPFQPSSSSQTHSGNVPESTSPNLFQRRLSFPLQPQPTGVQPSATGYLIFGANQPPTPIQPRPGSQNSQLIAQQHLTQIDGVRQQVSREVESLKSKLEQSENGRNNLVQELTQMRNQLDRLEQLKSPVQTVRIVETQPAEPKPELVERFLLEMEALKQQVAQITQQKKPEPPQTQPPPQQPHPLEDPVSARFVMVETERKRLEQLVRTLSSQVEALNQQRNQQSQPQVTVQPSVTETLVVSELRRIAQSLSSELNECRQRLKEANAQLLTVSDLRARQPSIEAENSRLRSENESNLTQISELKRNLLATNEKIAKLGEDLDAKRSLEQNFQAKDAELMRQIQELKANSALVKSQNEKMALELQLKSEKVQELEKFRDQLQQQQANALAMNAEHHHQFFGEIEQLKQENNDLKRRLMAATSDLEQMSRLRNEIKNSTQENDALESAKKEMELDVQRYEAEMRVLRTQLGQMTREQDCTNSELEVARQERIRLMDELSKAKIALENSEKQKYDGYEQEIVALKGQLMSSKTVSKCSQDEMKSLFLAVSSELDLVVDKTVFVLSLVLPQVEAEPSNATLNLAVDSPPTPLNLNKIQDSAGLARFLQEKISWISRNLEKLCSLLDRFPLSTLFRPFNNNQTHPRTSSPNRFVPAASDDRDDLLDAALKSVQNGVGASSSSYALNPCLNRHGNSRREHVSRQARSKSPYYRGSNICLNHTTAAGDYSSAAPINHDMPPARSPSAAAAAAFYGMRRTYSLSNVDRLDNSLAPDNDNNLHDQSVSQSERGKLFDLILRSQQILGDLKVDLCESDKIISKIKPRPTRTSFIHSTSDICGGEQQAANSSNNNNNNPVDTSGDNHRHPHRTTFDDCMNQRG